VPETKGETLEELEVGLSDADIEVSAERAPEVGRFGTARPVAESLPLWAEERRCGR
jgi:hypothetical protein